jgi:hypothetical protein
MIRVLLVMFLLTHLYVAYKVVGFLRSRKDLIKNGQTQHLILLSWFIPFVFSIALLLLVWFSPKTESDDKTDHSSTSPDGPASDA